jgi:hypothetical protein
MCIHIASEIIIHKKYYSRRNFVMIFRETKNLLVLLKHKIYGKQICAKMLKFMVSDNTQMLYVHAVSQPTQAFIIFDCTCKFKTYQEPCNYGSFINQQRNSQ